MHHVCKHVCNVCRTACYEGGHAQRQRNCADCSRICKSEECYKRHKQPDPVHARIPCSVTKYCKQCGATYTMASKKHVCAKEKCMHCKEPLEAGATEHQCFIQPLKNKTINEKYIIYDFETRYHDGRHEACYACAMDMAGNKKYFSSQNCVANFINCYRRPRYRGYTFIAHNASGFDNYLVLEYYTKNGIAPSIIMRGSRVILMNDVMFSQRWIDSFSFLPMRLSKTPAALGFEDMEKGFFPHLFNTRATETYIGDFPPPSDYGVDGMSESDRERFRVWYEHECNERTPDGKKKQFNMMAEMAKYCMNDVEVLRKACIIYRNTFLECTQLDPFAYTTLASSCMAVFKTLFLTRDTVALTYEGAYVRQNKYHSAVSMQWLGYVSHTENRHIRHALNGGEVQVGPYFVDGYDASAKTCYEFAGCFYHGCVKCYAESDVNPRLKLSFGELYRQFSERVTVLRTLHGVSVIVMWECEWARLRKSDPAIVDFLSTHRIPERLNPRNALFGGRTNAIKLLHKCEGDEQIRYYDFTSLYPYVQATSEYPTGHPEVIFENFKSIDQYFGFVKCDVLPPRGLYHPVLPYRCNDKLMFPLCRTCAGDMNQEGPCLHSDAERLLSGTWVSFELQKALEKGYRVICIDEVWHFPNKTSTLFKEYVKTFLKCKQEASGYPSHATTQESRDKYIRDYMEREGIMLDPGKIRYNSAVRSCNKLLLNSLWGRFSMRGDMASCELITEPERFTQLMFSDFYDVRQFCFISDEVAMVQWRYAQGHGQRVSDVNVFIGAMTTAYARLKLYGLLEKLQDRVLYCDTDSVVFTVRSGEWVPPTGSYLGDLTDELGGGDYITEFVSGGPKCYAYHRVSNLHSQV